MTTGSKPLVEICVDDIAGVRAAREVGADRVELCARLDIGGTTPSDADVEAALGVAPVGGLQVIIRPRGGSFVHDAGELRTMVADIIRLRRLAADAPVNLGFVVGVLRPDNSIDEAAARLLREAAGDAPLTFHRAFDLAPDQAAALEDLVDWGYDRVLTTGGHPLVANAERLRALVTQADARIGIIASGGLRSTNVAQLVAESACPEVHMRAPADGGGTDLGELTRIMMALKRPKGVS